MVFTETQHDGLTEILNIAFARTGDALSRLSGSRVFLDVPDIQLHSINELPSRVANLLFQEIATVHQVFTGPVSGDALLLLNYSGAVTLTNLFSGRDDLGGRLDGSGREALTEIGNILLNACLGMFGNLLRVQVTFSMPLLHLENLDQLLRSLPGRSEELSYAIIVSTAFHVRASAISGHLMIVLGVSSLDWMMRSVEEWETDQRRG